MLKGGVPIGNVSVDVAEWGIDPQRADALRLWANRAAQEVGHRPSAIRSMRERINLQLGRAFDPVLRHLDARVTPLAPHADIDDPISAEISVDVCVSLVRREYSREAIEQGHHFAEVLLSQVASGEAEVTGLRTSQREDEREEISLTIVGEMRVVSDQDRYELAERMSVRWAELAAEGGRYLATVSLTDRLREIDRLRKVIDGLMVEGDEVQAARVLSTLGIAAIGRRSA